MQSSQVDTRCTPWLWQETQVQILKRNKNHLNYSGMKIQKAVTMNQNTTFSYVNLVATGNMCPFPSRIILFFGGKWGLQPVALIFKCRDLAAARAGRYFYTCAYMIKH